MDFLDLRAVPVFIFAACSECVVVGTLAAIRLGALAVDVALHLQVASRRGRYGVDDGVLDGVVLVGLWHYVYYY